MKYLHVLWISIGLIASCQNVPNEKISRFANGKIEQRLNSINGIPEGNCETYYINGILASKGQYKNGKEDGVWINCYPSQKLQDYNRYENGKIVEALSWDTSGNLIMRNGNGYRIFYDGMISTINRVEYKNYLPNGKCESWMIEGQKLSEQYFSNGHPKGKWVFWNEDGSIERVESYAN